MNIRISKNFGRYNFASNDKDWLVELNVEGVGRLSALWREDDEPDVADLAPSELADLFEERLKRTWFSTSRQKDTETIAAIRARGEEIDREWAHQCADRWEAQAKELLERAGRRRNAYPFPEPVTPKGEKSPLFEMVSGIVLAHAALQRQVNDDSRLDGRTT